MSQVDEIKERLDIVSVLSAYMSLKKAGRNFKGLCPFHAEKTPSFIVFPESGTWHCFGACNTGGDVFSFVMKKEGLDFAEALQLLADKAGVVLEERNARPPEEESHLDRLRDIQSQAASYYHYLLAHAPQAQGTRDYVLRRGLTQTTVDVFEMGYAPAEWDALLRYLTGKGYTPQELLDAGLAIARESGNGYYDRFRHRLMVPIRDRRGHIIGFGARALDDTQPKYMNSPQTPLFDKGAVLFGLDRASKAIRARGEVVIVEGYMDVLIAHQEGQENVVASMGTALTDVQMQHLVRLTNRFILALDSDAAGDQATLRGLHLFRQSMGRRKVPTVTSSGGIGYEDRLLVDLRIMTLPPGRDPDEVILENTATWEELVRQAVPLVQYYLDVVTRQSDLSDARGKSVAVQAMKPILLELADEIERQHYIQRLAHRIRMDESIVEREVLGARPASARPRYSGRQGRRERESAPTLSDSLTPAMRSVSEFGLEEQCLYYLVTNPAWIHPLSLAFAEANIPFLEREDFLQAENQVIYLALKQAAESGQLVGRDALMGQLEPALADYLEQFWQQVAGSPMVSEEDGLEDLIRCAFRLKGRSLRQSLEGLYYLLQGASEEEGDQERSSSFMQLVQRQLLVQQQIDRALHARSMVGRRMSQESRPR